MLILAMHQHQSWQEHNRAQNGWFRVPHKKIDSQSLTATFHRAA
ncbi:hypothetical protein F8B43_3408 [Methylorubrum populi]|uniref:Uncharacterized protein n=1 Tax=Methylorubrum populi TaxID=223967 RepID=A0A833J4M0_9HYPH|nr:hypothetical protein F8B43_3408 [Methylorubrum populi]